MVIWAPGIIVDQHPSNCNFERETTAVVISRTQHVHFNGASPRGGPPSVPKPLLVSIYSMIGRPGTPLTCVGQSSPIGKEPFVWVDIRPGVLARMFLDSKHRTSPGWLETFASGGSRVTSSVQTTFGPPKGTPNGEVYRQCWFKYV